VQAEAYSRAAELFNEEYAYFSSFSSQWLRHAETYVSDMTERFCLGHESLVVEVASNDGYLLQYVKDRGIPCIGIEPTASTAAASRLKGINTIEEFFGVELASRIAAEGKRADLMTANNVLAHVPDINDFVKGFSVLLKPHGVATFEFPHLLNLIRFAQFDTIYHEHFSYLSLNTVINIFSVNGLSVFDVDEHPTHGGSLRVFAQRTDTGKHSLTSRLSELIHKEFSAMMHTHHFYEDFQSKAEKVKNDLLSFLIEARRNDKKVVAYGAAAKGNTLLNYSGVRPDMLSYVVDKNPSKQGKYMPGSRIPIVDECQLQKDKPDYVLILPWNLYTEISSQLDYIHEWGGKFVTAVPMLLIK
jgi:SAM-dependent methyltransferase